MCTHKVTKQQKKTEEKETFCLIVFKRKFLTMSSFGITRNLQFLQTILMFASLFPLLLPPPTHAPTQSNRTPPSLLLHPIPPSSLRRTDKDGQNAVREMWQVPRGACDTRRTQSLEEWPEDLDEAMKHVENAGERCETPVC